MAPTVCHRALPLGTAGLLFVSLDLMNTHEYDARYNIRKYLLCVFLDLWQLYCVTPTVLQRL